MLKLFRPVDGEEGGAGDGRLFIECAGCLDLEKELLFPGTVACLRGFAGAAVTDLLDAGRYVPVVAAGDGLTTALIPDGVVGLTRLGISFLSSGLTTVIPPY